MNIEEVGFDEWDEALPRSGFEVFHARPALETLAEHAPGECRLFVAYKGDHTVGMLPLFVDDRTIGSTITSPPPAYNVPKLGPLLSPLSPKQRKREQVNNRFVTGVFDGLDLDIDSTTTLFRSVCTPAYPDPRPFGWANLDIDVSFTYRIDLEDRPLDDVLSSFSKSLRREIRNARDIGVTVDVGDEVDTRRVFDDTRRRYEEQDRGFTLEWEYIRDVVRSLDDHARTYVARSPEGEYLSGVTVLFSNDDALFWQGGARTVYDGTSVNSLLHWRIIEDVVVDPPVDSVSGYDLMGANSERLCKYKSKFAPDLVPYYVVESSGAGMDVAKRMYRLITR